MPFGICVRQLFSGVPKMRKSIPRARKCAASERPYGPAPMMATCVDALMTTPFPKRDRRALHSGTPPRDEESQCKKETGAKCPRSRWLIERRRGLCAALARRERGLHDEPAGMRVDHADRAQ